MKRKKENFETAIKYTVIVVMLLIVIFIGMTFLWIMISSYSIDQFNIVLCLSVSDNEQKSVDKMIHIFKSNLSDKEKEKMLPIIDYLKVNDTIDPQMARKVTGKSKTTVFRYLQRLIELDIIKSEGDSVSTVYRRK